MGIYKEDWSVSHVGEFIHLFRMSRGSQVAGPKFYNNSLSHVLKLSSAILYLLIYIGPLTFN